MTLPRGRGIAGLEPSDPRAREKAEAIRAKRRARDREGAREVTEEEERARDPHQRFREEKAEEMARKKAIRHTRLMEGSQEDFLERLKQERFQLGLRTPVPQQPQLFESRKPAERAPLAQRSEQFKSLFKQEDIEEAEREGMFDIAKALKDRKLTRKEIEAFNKRGDLRISNPKVVRDQITFQLQREGQEPKNASLDFAGVTGLLDFAKQRSGVKDLLDKAEEAGKTGRFTEARRLTERALKISPRDIRGSSLLGQFEEEAGKVEARANAVPKVEKKIEDAQKRLNSVEKDLTIEIDKRNKKIAELDEDAKKPPKTARHRALENQHKTLLRKNPQLESVFKAEREELEAGIARAKETAKPRQTKKKLTKAQEERLAELRKKRGR